MTEAPPTQGSSQTGGVHTTSGATSTRPLDDDLIVEPTRTTAHWEPGAPDRIGNRIRGGPVWGGFAVAFATWLLLELVLFSISATGVDFGINDASTADWAWSGGAAVVAFFVGGMVAGAASPFRGLGTGALDGVVVWAIGVLAVVLLTSFAGGVTFGAFGDVLSFNQAVQQAGPSGGQVSGQVLDNFREAAGWAALFLALTLVAAALGGMASVKAWPRRTEEREDVTVDVR